MDDNKLPHSKYQVTELNENEFQVEKLGLPSFKLTYNFANNDFDIIPYDDIPNDVLEDYKLKAKRAIAKHILRTKSAHIFEALSHDEISRQQLALILSIEEFWGDFTNKAYVEKAKNFLWQKMSIKAKASAVYQANRHEIQQDRAEQKSNIKLQKKNRPEHTKEVIGVAMSFIFEN